MSSAMTIPLRAADLARTTVATSYVIRVERGTTENLTLTLASLTRNYWPAGDGQADADGGLGGVGDFLVALAAALATHTSGATWTVTLGADFRITIGCSAAFRIFGLDAATTLNLPAIGYGQTDGVTTVTSLTGLTPVRGIFAPGVPKQYDSRNITRRVTSRAESLSARVRIAVHAEKAPKRLVTFGLLTREQALVEYATSASPANSAEHVLDGMSRGRPVRYYDDDSVRTASSYFLGVLGEEYAEREEFIERDERHRAWRWSARFPMVGEVA